MSVDSATPILPGPQPAPPASANAPAADGSFAALVADAKPELAPKAQGSERPSETSGAAAAAEGKPPASPAPDDKAAAAAKTPTAPGALALQVLPTAEVGPETPPDAAASVVQIAAPQVTITQTAPSPAKAATPKANGAQAKGAPVEADAIVIEAAADAPPVVQAVAAKPESDGKASDEKKPDAAPQTLETIPAAPTDPILAPQLAAAPTPAPNAQTQGDETRAVVSAPARKPGLEAANIPPADDTKAQAGANSTGAPANAHAAHNDGGPKGASASAPAAQIADAAPTPAQTAPISSADAMQAASPAAPSAAASPLPVAAPQHGAPLGAAGLAVAQNIVRRFDGGTTSFQVRLDPAELGRVDIRLEVSRDKKVTATISADNPQTLIDLRASSRELQRALTESGLDLADNGLTFSDRQGSAPSSFAQAPLRGRESAIQDDPAPDTRARPLGIERWGGARVDVWA